MAVDDECTLRIIGRYQDQNIVNTLHYIVTAQVSSDLNVLSQLVSQWLSDFQAAWLAIHADAYELIGVKAFGKTGTSKTPAVTAVGVAGDVAPPGMPAFVCRTITLYTASVKHRRRGRLMLSGTPTSHVDNDDGSLNATAIAALNGFGAAIIAPVSIGGDDFSPGLPIAGTDPWEDFQDYATRETPSSITSRRVREFLVG